MFGDTAPGQKVNSLDRRGGICVFKNRSQFTFFCLAVKPKQKGELMSAAKATATNVFVRRTSLECHEYRTNFRQIDCDVIAVLDRKSVV